MSEPTARIAGLPEQPMVVARPQPMAVARPQAITNLYETFEGELDYAPQAVPHQNGAESGNPLGAAVDAVEGPSLHLRPFPANTPGYLRRQREIAAKMKAWREATDKGEPDAIDKLIELVTHAFRVDFDGPVAAGQTREDAIREALLDLSEAEFNAIQEQIGQSSVPPQNAAS